ncbi:hypothetical protein EYF80_044736 [Liparis tanakae]|uniref:Uncharacterized protein n=1 Tax=Liparis tanakae TaxID=230148 RepID=A0A4Z2FW07_9TELE|nr:hypothetical protein EYF80_044736 [Liparis tanakae]
MAKEQTGRRVERSALHCSVLSQQQSRGREGEGSPRPPAERALGRGGEARCSPASLPRPPRGGEGPRVGDLDDLAASTSSPLRLTTPPLSPNSSSYLLIIILLCSCDATAAMSKRASGPESANEVKRSAQRREDKDGETRAGRQVHRDDGLESKTWQEKYLQNKMCRNGR